MLFKAELDEYMKRKRIYKDNKVKAYAFIWDRCTKAMQAKVQSRSDFESQVYNDPLKLLNAIREHAKRKDHERVRCQQRNQGRSDDETSTKAVSGVLIPGECRSEQLWYSNEEFDFLP